MENQQTPTPQAYKGAAGARFPAALQPETWPVIWRVVAPRAGSFNHDMVFLETADEREARSRFHGLRRAGWPVRMERVHCGSLPSDAEATLRQLRDANAQNAGEPFPEVAGFWIQKGVA